MCVEPMPLKNDGFVATLSCHRLCASVAIAVSAQSRPCPASSPIDLRPLNLLDLGHMRLQLLVLVGLAAAGLVVGD